MSARTFAPEQDAHLPGWAYRLLALVAAAIGLTASGVTARFFVIGLERTEADSLARDALVLAGVLMILCELAAFFIAALVPRRQLRALRWQLTTCAVLLVGFEFATIAVTQMVLARSAEAAHDGTRGRIANLQASIEAQRAAAAALVATGSRSGQSTIASSRAEGAQALREAARIEGRTAILAAELERLQADQRPTLATVLGEPLTLAYQCARSGLITVMGLVMFAASGALLRAGRNASRTLAVAVPATGEAAAAAPAVPAAPAISERTAPARASFGAQAVPAGAVPAVPTGRRWAAAAGLGGAAMAAPAFAAVVVPPTAPAAPLSVPTVSSAPTVSTVSTGEATVSKHPAPADRIETVTQADLFETVVPDRIETVAPKIETPAIPATPETPRKKRTMTTATAPAKAPTDTGNQARFERVRAAIEAGQLKPSVRAIQQAEGGSTVTVSGYLKALEQAGVIERAGQGYRLVAVIGGAA